MSKIKKGLYLFYVEDDRLYPTIMNDEEWEMLQVVGQSIFGKPTVLGKPTIKVLDEQKIHVESWRDEIERREL